MTAKQRAARAKFKAVVKEASRLRKKNSKLTQAQAVKQAFAISYGKKRSKVGAAPKKKAAKKAAPTKVKAKKGKRTSEMHTDTKSHNVNIRVMSGVNDMALKLNMHHVQELRHLTNELSVRQYQLKKTIDQRKASRDKDAKNYFNKLALRLRDEIQGIKKQISIVKKFIK
jgi:hypothetical protein